MLAVKEALLCDQTAAGREVRVRLVLNRLVDVIHDNCHVLWSEPLSLGRQCHSRLQDRISVSAVPDAIAVSNQYQTLTSAISPPRAYFCCDS